MKYNVSISAYAHDDIDSALDYIINSLQNPIAAENLLDKIKDTYADIADNPLMFAYCNDSRLRDDGYRKAVINNYVLVFRVEEAAKNVYVVRFFYGGQNYGELI